ncbi:hypothetical protein C8J57DRAFT_123241 [Mycena rebaudengoi]|nr:hypothetical protein C8J57DRAFT_123241 [Mycena rebaudengoi]
MRNTINLAVLVTLACSISLSAAAPSTVVDNVKHDKSFNQYHEPPAPAEHYVRLPRSEMKTDNKPEMQMDGEPKISGRLQQNTRQIHNADYSASGPPSNANSNPAAAQPGQPPSSPPPAPAPQSAPKSGGSNNAAVADDKKADGDKSPSSHAKRVIELLYDPTGIDSSYSYVRIAPWWTRGEEGLWWRRDSNSGVIKPQVQAATTRLGEGGIF